MAYAPTRRLSQVIRIGMLRDRTVQVIESTLRGREKCSSFDLVQQRFYDVKELTTSY